MKKVKQIEARLQNSNNDRNTLPYVGVCWNLREKYATLKNNTQRC